jgi:intracellular sulfur oxidation DsrE/DsrF family protein
MPLFLLRLIALFLLLIDSVSAGANENTLTQLLALPSAPPGVVIEIDTSDEEGLSWALPQAQEAVAQLRAKFNALPIAIVTHGREQFALTQKRQSGHQAEHRIVQSLTKDNHVAVHVCGTHAERRGVSPEDFPAYVDVAAEGPAQINDYQALGYVLLVIRSH